MLDRSTRDPRRRRPTAAVPRRHGPRRWPAAGWRPRAAGSSGARRPRGAGRRLVAGIAVGARCSSLGLVAWLGWFSTVLTATAVEVRGVTGAAAAQVRQVAAVPLGGPVMRVDTDAVQRAPRRRQGLARGLRSRAACRTRSSSTVTPRVAVLAVRAPGGRVDVVDGDGLRLRDGRVTACRRAGACPRARAP